MFHCRKMFRPGYRTCIEQWPNGRMPARWVAPYRRPPAPFIDFTDDLLEEILDRDDSGSAAMFVHHDGHLRAAAAHGAQHFVERHCHRNVGNTTGVGCGHRLIRDDVAEQFLDVNAADHVVGVARMNREASVRPRADDVAQFAGGAVTLVPIDGIGSEVALMTYVRADKFLWASDYIQTLDTPTLYANEVMRATERAGIEPERVAAQHMPLSEWKDVVAAQK